MKDDCYASENGYTLKNGSVTKHQQVRGEYESVTYQLGKLETCENA